MNLDEIKKLFINSSLTTIRVPLTQKYGKNSPGKVYLIPIFHFITRYVFIWVNFVNLKSVKRFTNIKNSKTMNTTLKNLTATGNRFWRGKSMRKTYFEFYPINSLHITRT